METNDNDNTESATQQDFTFLPESDDDEGMNDDLNQTFGDYINRRKQEHKAKKSPKSKPTFNQLQFGDVKKRKNVDGGFLADSIGKMYIENANRTVDVSGKRPDRNYQNVMQHVSKDFTNLNISGVQDATFYKRNFLDIIINGNFRVKYIPNAATRDLALAYTSSHLDENGKPKYRLLPPNTTDPNDVPITDLNGDLVDDIVLVDKRGTPVIVNGYKLVYASPYKKVWKSLFNTRDKRKQTPFNVWLDQMFNKSKLNVDWEKGKYNIEANESMQNYIDVYDKKLHLGKPRISTRLSPNAYWVSLFAHAWKLYWMIYENEIIIKKMLNMVVIANAIFVSVIDIAIKDEMEQGRKPMRYAAWVAYRKLHKDEYNKKVLASLKRITEGLNNDIDLQTGQLKVRSENDLSQTIRSLLTVIRMLIFNDAFKIETKQVGQLMKQINNTDDEDIKQWKEVINNNIDVFVEALYGEGSGYIEYKAKQKEDKNRKKEIAMSNRDWVIEAIDNSPQE